MKFSLRDAMPALMLASLAMFATGCKPGDKTDAAKTADKAATDDKAGPVIPGLETEKQKVSYMIGLDIAKSLTPVKDEVDFDTMTKALKTALAGETPLMDEKQATVVREAFGQKLQAKQIAEMLAKAKANLTQGETFLAANAKKPGV
ncbi:MAG: FKBP-type peptidyl-prolyl cis-trans isomerase N-terminal domain-containing protein, partial [Gammaproteobacteria bacterium]|nr:FKBP-type peptidyl-prolyl cis-trans isomerase N-terminal domain-containing protein [Gammaproteobacteria bacterium]